MVLLITVAFKMLVQIRGPSERAFAILNRTHTVILPGYVEFFVGKKMTLKLEASLAIFTLMRSDVYLK